jgi:hypothetical protein
MEAAVLEISSILVCISEMSEDLDCFTSRYPRETFTPKRIAIIVNFLENGTTVK